MCKKWGTEMYIKRIFTRSIADTHSVTICISEFYFLPKSIIHQITNEMAHLIPTTVFLIFLHIHKKRVGFFVNLTLTRACKARSTDPINNQINSGMDQVTSKKGITEKTKRCSQCLLFMSISTNYYYFVSYFY